MPIQMDDPGHGGKDPGAVGNGLQEKDWVLGFTMRVSAGLRRCGVEVQDTRTSDVFVDLKPRADMANSFGADNFSSFHLNSNNPVPNGPGTGFESYIQQGYKGTDTDRKRRLIHDEMAAVATKYGLRDRGYKEDDLSVLRNTNMSAALFEIGYVNNPSDVAILQNPHFKEEMVEAAVRGICKVLNCTYVPVASEVKSIMTDVSDWAQESWKKAVDKKFIVGDGNGNYNPKETITKEQLVVMLDRLHLFD